MEATKLLSRDHKRVRHLFKRYEELGDGALKRKQEIFDQVYAELDVHTKVEEEIFYPFVKSRNDKQLDDMVAESLEEHRVVDRLVTELRALTPEDERFDAKMSVLKEQVSHHAFEEEEAKMFPILHQAASKAELEELGMQIEARQEALRKGWTGMVADWFRSMFPQTEG